MRTETRILFDAYMQRLADINHVALSTVATKFTADPSVQQTLENKVQESSEFLKRINLLGVDEQEGEKIGLGLSGPVASTQKTEGSGSAERATRDLSTLDDTRYRCEQTNYDTHVRYGTLDAWAKFHDFQTRLSGMIIARMALDRIMIGFNGVSRAATSNPATNPLLQDVNIGWLEKVRTKAPQRWIKETAAGSNQIPIGNKGDEYQTLDGLVYDLVNSLIEPWYQDDTRLVAVCGRKLLADKYFPLVNQKQDASEVLASDMIISQKRIGGLPAVRVPHFPANAVLVTRLDNLSIYYQRGAQRRAVIDNPKRDRIETYQSSNDAFVIEDYGCVALAENIVLA